MTEDLYYPAGVWEEVLGRITAAIEAEGQITLAQVRDLLGTSRRYAQALLEHMDSEGLTLRVGDVRRCAAGGGEQSADAWRPMSSG